MTANCEHCGAEMMVVLDDDEQIKVRFVGQDSEGRGVYVVDVVPKHPGKDRRDR